MILGGLMIILSVDQGGLSFVELCSLDMTLIIYRK